MKIKLDKSYDFLIPYNEPMIRIGNIGDGGYVIPKYSMTADSLLSFGVGNNWTFEKHWLLLNSKINISAYDATIDVDQFDPLISEDYKSFFTVNAKHLSENVSIDNVDTILKKVGPNTFLKMDIEGDEYKIISNISKASNLIGLVIEFHNLYLEDYIIQFKNAMKILGNTFNVVHLHANNYSGINEDGLPHTIEISFLRKEYCLAEHKRYDIYLNQLDSPNCPQREDYLLYFGN